MKKRRPIAGPRPGKKNRLAQVARSQASVERFSDRAAELIAALVDVVGPEKVEAAMKRGRYTETLMKMREGVEQGSVVSVQDIGPTSYFFGFDPADTSVLECGPVAALAKKDQETLVGGRVGETLPLWGKQITITWAFDKKGS